MKNRLLNEKDAFLAMTKFLTKWYSFTHSEDIATLLAGMDLEVWKDGRTFEPGLWEDWIEAVDTALQEKIATDKSSPL
jgi:hypothetical protein